MQLPWNRPSTVGRELDHRLAVVTGEGSQQQIRHPEPRKGTFPVRVWEEVPSLPAEGMRDYYRLPLLKEPVWIWTIPAYFYVGGVAGGSSVLAALLHGKRESRRLAGICRLLAFLGTTVGPVLLTMDLGRKVRFLNMLRVLRPTSPMSVGSWTLAGSGLLAAFNLLLDGRPSGKWPAVGLAAGGVMLAGYTGVLLANTANPLWQGTRKSLPVLFTASAIASTAGVLEMTPLNRREEDVVHTFGRIGKVAEAATMLAMEREVSGNEEAAACFRKGKGGLFWKSAKVLIAAGILVSLVPTRNAWKRKTGAMFTSAGAVCLRFALLELGKEAAREPRAATTG